MEPIALNGEQMNQTTIVPGFGSAEEKAVKAIQKHSMNINGMQRNNKIDEAYLLLGKARYYDRRFFPRWKPLIICWKIMRIVKPMLKEEYGEKKQT